MSDQAFFQYSPEHFQSLVQEVLAQARQGGATAAEVDVSEGSGLSVTVRLEEVETIEYNRDKELGVSVYFGQQRGHASTSDFSAEALRNTVLKALTIARHTAADPFAGLADPALMAKDPQDLELYHPWDMNVEEGIERALRCETSALAVDRRLSNSEGATAHSHRSHFCYGNSAGFVGGYAGSSHGLSCAVIAGKNADMQRDYWYTTARHRGDMESPEQVGKRAGERAVRRLKAQRLSTRQVPVLFEAPVATSLISHFVRAVSGGSLYRKTSFLLDSLGKPIFSPQFSLHEEPHRLRGLASTPFDDEGVATRPRTVVADGVVQGYFLGSYSARKLGMITTGNAGGSHNLVVPSFGGDFEALLRQMDRGLLVTELLGQGVNSITGDYSRGAAGFWVENGVIQYPVHEITIAGNLKAMYSQILAVGSDSQPHGSKICGSILIGEMTVAGE